VAIQKTEGFVLRREDLRETSVILTVFTRDFGKLKLVSKGVRSPEQRFISAYELFVLDEVVFYEKKKNALCLLSQCELVDFFPGVRGSLERISYAMYFVELLDSVTPPGDRNIKLYELFGNSLRLLSGTASPKRVARIFEIKLLSILGLMPRMRLCVLCGGKPEGGRMNFSVASGGILCEKCARHTSGARSVLAGTVNFISHIESLPFERLKHIKVTKAVGSGVEMLLSSFIKYHLDIRPRSLEFIKQIGV